MTVAVNAAPIGVYGTSRRRISATIGGKEYLYLIARLPSGQHRPPVATQKLGRSSWLVRL
jgi:hypothetical protein